MSATQACSRFGEICGALRLPFAGSCDAAEQVPVQQTLHPLLSDKQLAGFATPLVAVCPTSVAALHIASCAPVRGDAHKPVDWLERTPSLVPSPAQSPYSTPPLVPPCHPYRCSASYCTQLFKARKTLRMCTVFLKGPLPATIVVFCFWKSPQQQASLAHRNSSQAYLSYHYHIRPTDGHFNITMH